ncbi:MAG: hypothetical protein LQ350_003446 [Teloschistes chrysophthalmus]|nr:MAG: hypothetical protein LQ350_003446 [Niorma chrysophthalma]
MATSFPSAQAYTTPPNSHGVHAVPHGLQQFSPSETALNTPVNQSPSSPEYPSNFSALPLAGRQLRPPKSPMYIPAALRPTEKPHRAAPLTPPRSLHGSTESLERTIGSRPVSRRSTASGRKRIGLQEVAEDENAVHHAPTDDDEEYPPVEGMPTRSTETAYSRKSIMRDDIQVINDALPPPFNSHQPQYVLLALNSGAAFVDAGAGATRGVNILEHETNRPTSGVAVTASMLARVFPEGFYHLLLRFMDFLEG